MLPRTLCPLVLCAAFTWPLGALACVNSMEPSSILTRETVWLDLFLWTVGAVFLNRVVLVNVLGDVDEGQAPPSRFRQAFFLLVGGCIVLMMLAVSAAGPLLGLAANRLPQCLQNGFPLLLLLASPVVVFVLHTVLFRRLSQWLFGGDRKVALVTLVLTSVVLSLGVDLARQVIAPLGCQDQHSEY